jgi:AraC-like DNA-binding protein
MPPLPIRHLALDRWLAALADPAVQLDLVAERPAYWEFSGGWSADWRSLAFHLLYLVVQGDGHLWLDQDRPRPIQAGTAFWLPPHTRHRMEQCTGRNYFIRFRLVHDGANLSFGSPQVRQGALHLLPFFQLLSDDLRFSHPWLPERLRAVLTLLATDGQGAVDADAEAGRLSPAQRRRLAQLVEECWQATLSPADLARAVGMSPVSFARAFRRSFDCSARRWLADQRLHRVGQLLLADHRPVEDVAADAGFANPSQFARRFRSVFGVGPAEYRRRQVL